MDARKYLRAVRLKAQSLGVHFINGKLIDFEVDDQRHTQFSSPVRHLKRGLVRKKKKNLIRIQSHFCA